MAACLADNICKWVFSNEYDMILNQIPLIPVPRSPIDNNPALGLRLSIEIGKYICKQNIISDYLPFSSKLIKSCDYEDLGLCPLCNWKYSVLRTFLHATKWGA